MKKLMKAFIAVACAAWGGVILSCSGGTDYVGTSGNSTTTPTTDVTPVPDSWDFANRAAADIVYDGGTADWVTKFNTNTITKESDGTRSLDKSGDIEIRGSLGNLTLTLLASKPWSGLTDPNYSYAVPASGLRIKNPAMKIANVIGSVVMKVDWECMAGKAAGERSLEIYLGEDGTKKSFANEATTSISEGNLAMTPAEYEFDAGTGKNVFIGGSNNIYIKSISISVNTATFASKTENVANNAATLGLVGTSVTSDKEDVATATIADGNIVITSKSAGDATLTVTDANSKTTTIAVGVKTSGAISAAPTVYERPAPEKDTDYTVSELTLTAKNAIEYSKDDGSTWEPIAANGTYTAGADGYVKVRFAASDAYNASKSATVSLTSSNDGSVEQTATISYDATATSPAFALTETSSSTIFGTIQTSFSSAAMGTIGGVSTYTLVDGYPKVEGSKFSPSSTSNAKVASILDADNKATLKGYSLKSTLVNGSTKVALTKDENCAIVDYSFTLSAVSDVSINVVAFNSQSGNLYGKVVILDSTNTEKASSGAKTTGSKEDNDASVTISNLAAGTYTVRYSWCPKADVAASNGIKTFQGGVQSVTITATAK